MAKHVKIEKLTRAQAYEIMYGCINRVEEFRENNVRVPRSLTLAKEKVEEAIEKHDLGED